MNPTVIVGGGLNGLMVADLLAQRAPQRPTILVEASPECGGLLRSFDYGKHGKFDYGTHIPTETGIAGLDAYMSALLAPEEWNRLEGHRRNLAGLAFNGRIQLHTSYPDLTTLPPDTHRACVDDFFATISEDDGSGASNAHEYLTRRYGNVISAVLGPIVETFAKAPASELSLQAVKLCPLDGAALFDEETVRLHTGTPRIGRRIAFVDQRDLPVSQQSPLASIYPRKRGIGVLVDALLDRIEGTVDVRLNTQIDTITSTDGVPVVRIADEVIEADHVYWTANILALAGPAGVAVDFKSMDAPLTTVLCHLILDEAPGLGDVHFAHVAEPGFDTYRYTNYNAFTDPDTTGTPLTVEILIDPASQEEDDYTSLAMKEMVRLGLIPATATPMFAATEILPYGFPRPTVRNLHEITRVRADINRALGGAVTPLGVGAQDELFFMQDILRNSYEAAVAV